MKYKHLFFDLDHTLWDTDRNSRESLYELYIEAQKDNIGLPLFEDFYHSYRSHNERLWGLYAENKIGRDAVRINRFRFTLEEFKINNYVLAEKLATDFVGRTPLKQHLISGAKELLDYVAERYDLSIITNGFKESQHIKLKSAEIGHYFKHVFISEEVGFNKPDPRIFEHALSIAGIKKQEALMIGDTYETDIAGALAAGIDAIYFSANENGFVSTHKISSLEKMMEIV